MGVCCSDRQDIEDYEIDCYVDFPSLKKIMLKRRDEAYTEFQSYKEIRLADKVIQSNFKDYMEKNQRRILLENLLEAYQTIINVLNAKSEVKV
jgi:hypothetical protein